MSARIETTSGAAEAPPASHLGGVHGRVARMVVVFSVALTITATALIFWRWANVTEPSSYVIVNGDASCNGTVVVVRSAEHPDAVATLSGDNNYAAAIFLHPGTYTLTATLNGDTLAHGNMLLAHRRAKVITIRGPKTALPPQQRGVS